MGRRKSKSDDAVLAAAERVMMQYGPVRFTLALAAEAAELSPATLMQRFGDKRGLILAVLQRSNDLFVAANSHENGPRNMQAVLDLLCGWVVGFEGGKNFSEQMQWLAEDTRNVDFQRIAQARFRLMRAAIELKLPETVLPRQEAARLIEAQWHGILVRWGIDREGDLTHSLRTQLEPLLGLLEQ